MSISIHDIGKDLPSFSWWAFDGCAKQGRTHMHFEQVLEGRLVEGRRKTHQPAGSRLAADDSDADALRQRINRSYLMPWSDANVRERLGVAATAAIPDALAYVIDDTGIEKKGKKSPGVHRQYTGTAGKVTNCQIIVSTHLASFDASAPLEMDLYLPRVWCDDADRRAGARVPDDVSFLTKPELALEQLDRLLKAGGPKHIVLADAGYGDNGAFRAGLTERGFPYAVGVTGTAKIWRAGEGPEPPKPWSGRGRPPTGTFPGTFHPTEMRAFALELEDSDWTQIELRPGQPNPRRSRFSAHRIRTAHRASAGRAPGAEQWLIIEWRRSDDEPCHFYLSTLPADTSLEELARTVKLRWRVERDYQDMKQETGLSHYEGRTWVGFKHHLTICMAATVYLTVCRSLFPPEPSAIRR